MLQLRDDLSLKQCLGNRFACNCGRVHNSDLQAAEVGPGAMDSLPGYMQQYHWQKPFIICDKITYDIAGKTVAEKLQAAGLDVQCHILTHTTFDESTLGELVISMDDNRDVVIGVGTGSINDMSRYFSYKLNKPYCVVATAAPMDGFASSISALTVNNLKTTFNVRTPVLIIGDTDILKNAPYSMIAGGLGDLIGKFTCLCDWKLARIITGEYYCGTTVALVENHIKQVLAEADKARERDPKIIGDIMEGLLLSGVAMSLIGNSRPASGCEHHISHFWEMWFEQHNLPPVPHGTQVGVGTVLILKLTELLRKQKIDFDAARAAARAYDPQKWQQNIRSAYGAAADGIISLEEQAHKNDAEGCLCRIDTMESHWNEIIHLLEELPSSEHIKEILNSLDSPSMPSQIGIGKELLQTTLLYCKEVRARYTILQMLWDLNLLAPLVEEVVNACYEK